MAFHRVGNSIYSDDELRSRNEENIAILVPLVVTAVGIYYFHSALSALPFFMLHTTTAKLIYVVVGLGLFCIAHALRKLIVSLVVLAIGGTILTLSGIGIWQWLMH